MSERIVTLPAQADALAFARHARKLGAQRLEVRDDLSPDADLTALARVLPLLLSHRGGHGFPNAPADRDLSLGFGTNAFIVSWHSDEPLSPDAAEARWARAELPSTTKLKHVEPLGEPTSGARLLELQRRLIRRFGAERVTVLATGACALPWRAVLAQNNAFDYLAVDAESASAAGQRLLRDAVRADVRVESTARLAIIGHRIAHARSPLVHPPPFDRWDLPVDAPVRELVDALRPHYRGFAVTSPFKRALGHDGAAVNTLVRRPQGWLAVNTDVEGARAVLAHHRVARFTALGDGGATWALRKAAPGKLDVVVTAKQAEGQKLSGDLIWTWPENLDTPRGLRLDGARVLVIAYGAPARRLNQRIRGLGAEPVRAGVKWFIAQARAQRRLWAEAS